jgi:hypothetical protein
MPVEKQEDFWLPMSSCTVIHCYIKPHLTFKKLLLIENLF